MGRNKIAFTGHTDLKKTFQRKGAIKKHTNGQEIRMYITYTQLEHKEGYGYIYEVNYDGHIFYNVFKERYYQTDEGGTACIYPGDAAFYDNAPKWAWTTTTIEEAKDILNILECSFNITKFLVSLSKVLYSLILLFSRSYSKYKIS